MWVPFWQWLHLPGPHGGGEREGPPLPAGGVSAGGLEGHIANDIPSSVMAVAVPSPGGCPRVGGCNETRMLEKLPLCGKAFADRMHKVDVWKWCNLSEFIV